MKITIASAKVGDEVVLTTNKWGDTNSNPVWGGKFGKLVGKISSITANAMYIRWPNSTVNCYDGDSLELATAYVVVTKPLSSLKDAVTKVVTSFVERDLNFSAYEVTKALRVEINEGRITLDDRQKEDVNGIQTQKITHDEVRVYVRPIVSSYGNYAGIFNGDYVVYTCKIPSVPAVSAPVAVKPSVIITPTATVVTPAATSVAADSKPVTVTKLLTYVANKQAPTLKQIQSRFKGSPITVRSIATLAQQAGLRIDQKTPYHASVVTK